MTGPTRCRRCGSRALLVGLAAVLLFAIGARLTTLEAGSPPAVPVNLNDVLESPMLTGEAEMVDPAEMRRLDARLFGDAPASDQPRDPFHLSVIACFPEGMGCFPRSITEHLTPVTIESIMERVGEIRVLSIMFNNNRSLANVNDRVVRAGDTLTINGEEVEVIAIQRGSVRFKVTNQAWQIEHEFEVPLTGTD